MLAALRERRNREDQGFTLIELMVVVLIIAILLAIAIPTFLSAQDRARDRAAQSNLRNGLTAGKTIATDFDGAFVKDSAGAHIDAAAMLLAEPSLNFVDATAVPTTWTDEVVVVVENDTTLGVTGAYLTLYNLSKSGDFFCISADYQGNVTYNKGAASTDVDTHAKCNKESFAG